MTDRKISKVVIPVAGLGSRFLPATKALPKELLPIVDKPIIHHIVKEAVDAGIETVVFITSRPKILIEDYFDPADLTSHKLTEAGKHHLIEETIELSKKIDIVSVRQQHPEGLGHAVLMAEPVVSGQNFAVLLGDEIVRNNHGPSSVKQCVDAFQSKERGSVIGVIEVPKEETYLYGVCDFGNDGAKGPGPWEVKGFVEKPAPEDAPSNWALPGRYVFEPGILNAIRETPRGKGNEIQLTDAMVRLLKTQPFFAQAIKGERFDTGSKLGYIIANVAYGLADPEHQVALRKALLEMLKNEK
ncbi:UTP--glucose-1-phosphate uridylyltransferase [bacterium]|nr:UTP--glucose-1-phosphate uridylyltransferase [bacterium]